MKYSKETLGRIEAVWNKHGGTEGINAFLAGRTKVVPVEFHQFGEDLLEGKGTYTVSGNYNHDTQIDDFGTKTRKLKSTQYYDDKLTSKNFAKATNKLVPGKTYGIKMHPIWEGVESEHCLAFMDANSYLKVGAQGLTALQADQPDIFPTGKFTVSFDEKGALRKDAHGDHGLPSVYRYPDGDWRFHLAWFESPRDSRHVLLCFYDLDESLST